jgi:hypothetical protein
MKRPTTIAADEVPSVFDDKCIQRLAKLGLPPEAKQPERFPPAILKAVETFIRDAAVVSSNDVNREITGLYRAALHRDYQKTADRVRHLSTAARAFLNKRRVAPGLGWKVPDDPGELLDPATQDQVCENIVSLCRIGAHWKKSRNRPSGRPSMTFVPHLHAPPLQRHFPKRSAELNFVMNLQLAYRQATEEMPPLTVRRVTPTKRLIRTKHPRKRLPPFAVMVRECLKLVGRPDADGVELINKLQSRANKQLWKLAPKDKRGRPLPGSRLSRSKP